MFYLYTIIKNKDIMKKFELTTELVNDIFGDIDNINALIWADDTEITKSELLNNFFITIEDYDINLEHNTEDYRIEDITLADVYHDEDLIEII